MKLDDLIVLNDSVSRMAPGVIAKTIPELLNHPETAFTQHSTKTLREQRNRNFFLRTKTLATDMLLILCNF